MARWSRRLTNPLIPLLLLAGCTSHPPAVHHLASSPTPPTTPSVSETPKPNLPSAVRAFRSIQVSDGGQAAAFGFGSLWIVRPGGSHARTVLRIDAASDKVVATTKVGLLPLKIAIDASGVWVANAEGACVVYNCSQGGPEPPPKPHFPEEDSVWRIDPATNHVVAKIRVVGPQALAAGFGSVWVGEGGNRGVIARIDERTNRIVDLIHMRTPMNVSDVVGGADAVWMLGQGLKGQGHLVKIDPRTDRIVFDASVPGNGLGVLAVRGIQLFMSQSSDTPGGGAIAEIDRLSGKPGGLADNPLQLRSISAMEIALGRLWSVYAEGWIQGVNPVTHTLLGETQLSRGKDVSLGPWIVFGAGTLWVSETENGKTRILRLVPEGSSAEPADSPVPVAGICGTMTGNLATFGLNVDTPGPRCGRVRASQRLRLINNTGVAVEIQFVGREYILAPGETRTFSQRFGDVWQRGVHWTVQTFYPGSGSPEIWLV